MITVIIPALNEEKIIGQVVRIDKQSLQVAEVIMVDDKSMDNTIEEARKEVYQHPGGMFPCRLLPESTGREETIVPDTGRRIHEQPLCD